MKRRIHILLILIALLASQAFLAACTPETPTPPAPTETAAPTQPLAPTLTPTLAIPPTPTPHPLSISPDNADQIVQLGQWGKGTPSRVIWSPDGSMIAIATSIGTYLLDGTTFKEFMFLESKIEVTSIDFSPDGSMLALGGCEHHDLNLVCTSSWVKIFSTETGNEIQDINLYGRNQPFLKFRPDGKHLLGAGCNAERGPGVHCIEGNIMVWDIATGETVHEWVGHGGWVNNIAFHPNGILVASSSGGNWSVNNPGSVIIWNTVTGRQVLTITLKNPEGIHFIMFDQSGEFLMVGNSELQLDVYSTRNGKLLDTTQLSDESKATELFSRYLPMNAILVMEDDNTYQIWDKAGTLHSRISIPENTWCWAVSPDVKLIARATASDIFVTEDEKIIYQESWQNAAIEASGTLPDGRWVMAGSKRDNSTYLFDPLTGEEIQSFPINPYRDAVAISPNGGLIAISIYSNTYYPNEGFILFDIESGQELFSDPSPIYSLAFSPDAAYLATGGTGGKLNLWNVSDPQNAISTSLTDPQGSHEGVNVVAFTPDGKHLFAGDWDSTITVWEMPSGKLETTINDSFAEFFMLSPDSKTLIYKDNHNINRLLFMDIAQIIGPTPPEIQAPAILENNSFQSGFAFQSGGQILAYGASSSYSEPASIYLLDTEDHSSLSRLKGHTNWVRFLAFSPNGRYLVSNGFDGTTRIWGLPEP